jgi:quinol monooxygenase YgiN
VTVEYRVSPQDREAFLLALEKVGSERRRDGAYRWDVYEDTAEQGRFVETFVVSSWIEHLRQRERVTNAVRLQDIHRRFSGKRDFARQRQRRRNGPRNPIDSLQRLMRRRIPASSGLFATSREISVCTRLRDQRAHQGWHGPREGEGH